MKVMTIMIKVMIMIMIIIIMITIFLNSTNKDLGIYVDVITSREKIRASHA